MVLPFLDSLLSKGKAHKEVVGIAVTPGLGLEVAVIDKNTKVVKSYGRKKLDYDISRREITDIGQFKIALGELLNQMDIIKSAQTLAYLVLPNVYFDFIELPAGSANEEVKTAILSEAEEFFIFKREEPVSGFAPVRNINTAERTKYVYSSFQKEQIDNLKAAVEDCGLKLIGIETNYTATLRGLYTAGLLDDVILEDSQWTAMLINTNSFVMFKMEGKELIGHLEVPLAVRAYSVEESYEAIISNATQILDDYQSSKLYIISQVDEISADIIKRKMRFNNEIIAIESNKFANSNQLMEVKSALDFNEANSLTPAVIGATNLSSDFGLILNVFSDDINSSLGVYFTTELFGQKVDVTSSLVTQLGIILIVLLALIFGGVYLGVGAINTEYKKTIETTENEIRNVEAQIEAASKNGDKEEVNINMEIDKVAEANIAAINFYDSIATDIPKNVWLTAYYNKNGTQIAVRGIAENIADVYEYYKNLRIVSPQSDLKLNELKVLANDAINGNNNQNNNSSQDENANKLNDKIISSLLIDESDRLYSFEIMNTQMNTGVVTLRDETQIITAPSASSAENSEEGNVEEVSQQMKPARKRKVKNGKVN